MTGPTSEGPDLRNREGEAAYDITWPWRDGPLAPGLTCVFRVRNEARNLPWVLPPVFEAVQHVVLVDNGSDDGTTEVAQRVVDELSVDEPGVRRRFTLASYPFEIARAGAEHLATPPDSVHSLSYFYNWSFSHVRTAYSMKWDGDMVLTREGVDALRDASWQTERAQAVLVIPRHPVTVVSDSEAWIDLGYRFLEPWVYPMGPETTFAKAFEWEVREWPGSAQRVVLPEGLVVELKWSDLDELDHWSESTAFDDYRTPRKKREQQVASWIRGGAIAGGTPPEGLVRIEAPAGVHVVDHVTGAWMARAERPLCLRLDY